MNGDWQSYIAIAIVLIATSYLIRRSWLSIAHKRAGRCGACGSCPAGETSSAAASGTQDPTGKPLVQLNGFTHRN
jgi:hypothetical protein